MHTAHCKMFNHLFSKESKTRRLKHVLLLCLILCTFYIIIIRKSRRFGEENSYKMPQFTSVVNRSIFSEKMILPFRFSSVQIIEEGRTSREAITAVKEWIETTLIPPLQEEFIVLFLLSCTNDISVTTQTIENYFRIKSKTPQIYNGLDLDQSELSKSLRVLGFTVIPARMANNVVVIFVKLIDNNYQKFDVIAGIKLSIMLTQLSQIYDPPNELVLIVDMEGIGFMHLTCFKMNEMISHLEYIQEGMPLKIRDIHILNSNYIFNRVIDLFKVFIKSELMARIKTYSPGTNMEEFYLNQVPASSLPAEYGGDLPSFQKLMAKTIEELRKVKPFFEAEEQLRSFYRS